MHRPITIAIVILVFAMVVCAAAIVVVDASGPSKPVANRIPGATVRPGLVTSGGLASHDTGTASPTPPASADAILAARDRLDRTVWPKEVKAQEYEESFVALWDAMRAQRIDQHTLLAEFPFDEMTIRDWGQPKSHPWDIMVSTMDGESHHIDHDGWRALVKTVVELGYRVQHCEFHHAAFDLEQNGTARSKLTMKLFMVQSATKTRLVLSGAISVVWADELDEHHHHVAKSIHATDMSLTSRTGPDGFSEALHVTPMDLGIAGDANHMDPVLVYDLDRDGLDDIVLPSLNLVMLNRSQPGVIRFENQRLFARPLSERINAPGAVISGGLVADLTGDGRPDVLVSGPGLSPTLFVADVSGRFPDPGTPIAGLELNRFQLPITFTAGDVDGDGLMDVWIGQYQPPYQHGNLPYPYWDALDGPPSFLLMNTGNGTFRDATESSGLVTKRTRRNFSASLIDLDGDRDLDLITINDFAGVDIFLNDGHGAFTDASDTAVDERSTFGMSHAFADFNGDGKIDVFVAGMGSTTARRLEYMKLGRDEFPDHQKMRMKMGYGNRMLLGTSDHRFAQAPFNDQVARTGWSWGCSALDVANDGNMSLYIANGQRSAQTAKDYCTRYWTQDIYTASPGGNDELLKVFMAEDERDKGVSWNGFEHKALLMNEGGKAFRDVAFPMGVGFEWDGRTVVSTDFDKDGLDDILVMDVDVVSSPDRPRPQSLHICHNDMKNSNHWIEVRLQDEPGHPPMAATISVEAGGRKQVGVIVSGDSYRSQHPLRKHFGLASTDRVDAVEVAWADGMKTRMEAPQIDRVLLVRPAAAPKP